MAKIFNFLYQGEGVYRIFPRHSQAAIAAEGERVAEMHQQHREAAGLEVGMHSTTIEATTVTLFPIHTCVYAQYDDT